MKKLALIAALGLLGPANADDYWPAPTSALEPCPVPIVRHCGQVAVVVRLSHPGSFHARVNVNGFRTMLSGPDVEHAPRSALVRVPKGVSEVVLQAEHRADAQHDGTISWALVALDEIPADVAARLVANQGDDSDWDAAVKAALTTVQVARRFSTPGAWPSDVRVIIETPTE